MPKVDTLFVDLGGVLLTNGWDRVARKNAAQQFELDWEDFEDRHKRVYDDHEKDKITLNEYLNAVIFWKERPFTLEQFRAFVFAQSKPFPEMLNFVSSLKKDHQLKVIAISNEGRDLAEYRIKTFRLDSVIDTFFVSCFVHYQKPDPHIYQMALDVLQMAKDRIIYVDDRPNLIEAGAKLGIRGIVHTSFESTRSQLLSLWEPSGVIH